MLTRHTLFRLRNLLHAVLAIAACGATSALAQGKCRPTVRRCTRKKSRSGRAASCQDCHGFAGTFRAWSFPVRPKRRSAQASKPRSPATAGGMGVVFRTPHGRTQQTSDVAAHILVAVPYRHRRHRLLRCPPRPLHRARSMFGSTAVGATSATVGVLLTNSATNAATITLGNPAVMQWHRTGSQILEALLCRRPDRMHQWLEYCNRARAARSALSSFRPPLARARPLGASILSAILVPAREITLQGTATGAGLRLHRPRRPTRH